MNISLLGAFLSLFIGLSIPLMLIAYGGMFTERAGVSDIAIEGIVIIGALVGLLVGYSLEGAVSSGFSSQLAVLIAIICAGIGGGIFSILLGLAVKRFHVNQNIVGIALDIIAPMLFAILVFDINGEAEISILTYSAIAPSSVGLSSLSTDSFLYSLLFTSLNQLGVLLIVILIAISSFVIYKSKFGFRLDACGKNPSAARSLGINVNGTLFGGVVTGGILAGIGGFVYVLIAFTVFNGEAAGIGFIALVIMIFGKWKPGKIILASLLFSFFISISIYASSISWLPSFSGMENGYAIYKLLPFLVAIIVLIFNSKTEMVSDRKKVK